MPALVPGWWRPIASNRTPASQSLASLLRGKYSFSYARPLLTRKESALVPSERGKFSNKLLDKPNDRNAIESRCCGAAPLTRRTVAQSLNLLRSSRIGNILQARRLLLIPAPSRVRVSSNVSRRRFEHHLPPQTPLSFRAAISTACINVSRFTSTASADCSPSTFHLLRDPYTGACGYHMRFRHCYARCRRIGGLKLLSSAYQLPL